MTWTEVGWAIIGLGAVLLLLFNILFARRGRYRVRPAPAAQAFLKRRVRAFERGENCQVLLGDQFWSRAYPALGLHAIMVSSSLMDVEPGLQEMQVIAAGTGELALFARQIHQGTYQDGYSAALNLIVPGLTPNAFVAGFLADINLQGTGPVGLFGNFAQMGALVVEVTEEPFAAAGSISAQAALFLTTRDLLIGEEIYLLPGLFHGSPGNQAAWISEDILRVVLIALLMVAAVLKLVGIL